MQLIARKLAYPTRYANNPKKNLEKGKIYVTRKIQSHVKFSMFFWFMIVHGRLMHFPILHWCKWLARVKLTATMKKTSRICSAKITFDHLHGFGKLRLVSQSPWAREIFSFIFEIFLLTFFILTVLAIPRFQTKIRLLAINKFFLRVVQLRCHDISFPLASCYAKLNEKPRETLVTSLSNLPVCCFKVIFVQQLLI